MSILKVSTIQDIDGNNSSTPEQVASGRARVWVEFSGQNEATEIVSFGVSSLDRRSNGNYTVNFSSNFSNTNYAVFASAGANIDTYDDGLQNQDNVPIILNKFVDKVYIGMGDLDDGAEDDVDRVSVVIFA
tara:strand:+ start:393 stop:785 length:393 start_codon:yes stop_codon:yes gene_type:complete